MTQRYFAQIQGQTVGPMPAAALKKMAQDGQLSPDDVVWKEGAQQNVKAGQISGLFKTPQKQATAKAATPATAQQQSPAASDNWHYAKSGVGSDSVAGPHTLAEMKQLLLANQIHAGTFVASPETKNQWVELRDTVLRELLPAETQQAEPEVERQPLQTEQKEPAAATQQPENKSPVAVEKTRSATPPLGAPALSDSATLPPQLTLNHSPVPQLSSAHRVQQPRTNGPANKVILVGITAMAAIIMLVVVIYAVTNSGFNLFKEVAQKEENDSDAAATEAYPDGNSNTSSTGSDSSSSSDNFSSGKPSAESSGGRTKTKSSSSSVNQALQDQLTIEISRTETALRLAESSAETVFQQQVGRVDGCIGMTGVVARALGASSSEVRLINSSMDRADLLAENVFQQLAGHLKTHFEMLKLAAQKAGADATTIAAAESSLRLNDSSSETVNQQIAARILGVMKMTEVLAKALGSNSSTTSAITRSMKLDDARCETVYQQMSARQTGVVKMLGAAARSTGSGSSSVSTIERGLITDDGLVDTVQQQYSARIKRAYEMTRLHAKTLVGQ